jgi:hypothetical protein
LPPEIPWHGELFAVDGGDLEGRCGLADLERGPRF